MITFTLINRNANRQRYLCTQDGVISSPPVPADGFATLSSATLVGNALAGPLRTIVRATIDGIGAVWAAGNVPAHTQAQARAILNSEDPTNAVLTNQLVPHAILGTQGRAAPTSVRWTVDANVDGGGNPVVEVRSDVGIAATAILDIEVQTASLGA